MIFNKDNNGAEEIKAHLGFIYKSSKFENLMTYIRFAERDIRKIIGDDLFDAAEEHYLSEHFHEEPDEGEGGEGGEGEEEPNYELLDELVEKIQLPVALFAYKRYAPSADLTHSDKGRQMFSSENEKPAWEWMIERDNQNIISLAHEATDVLLEFLDAHIDDDPLDELWGGSAAYLKTKDLLINNAETFNEYFPIRSSRMLFITLYPFLKEIENRTIRPCFTEDKWDEIKEQIKDGDVSDDNELIIRAASLPLALLTMATGIRRLSSELLPNGLFSNYFQAVEGKSTTTKTDRIELSKTIEGDALEEFKKLQNYLSQLDAEEAGEEYIAEDPTERMDPDNKFLRL